MGFAIAEYSAHLWTKKRADERILTADLISLRVSLFSTPTPEAALSAWPTEIAHLQRIGRDQQADKLQANFEKLRALTELEKRGVEGWRGKRVRVTARGRLRRAETIRARSSVIGARTLGQTASDGALAQGPRPSVGAN